MPYIQDEDGVWWYQDSRQRTKCLQLKCSECGKTFHRVPNVVKKDKPTYCSRSCSNKVTARLHRITRRGSGSPTWKGGRKKAGGGYIELWMPDHPDSNGKGYVKEHRYVMEQHIGRRILPEETVHHKNGVRHDNRIENLELWVSQHPSGQRVEDMVQWAKIILKRYEPEALKG